MSQSRQLATSFLFLAKICVVASLTLVACSEENDISPAPVIRSFSPNSGVIGSPVTIYGDQFIPTFSADSNRQPNTSIITFNGTVALAEYVYQDSIGKQRINTTVPIGATSGKITAMTNGITVSSPDDFIITVPIYLPNVTVTTVSDYSGIDLDIDNNGNLYVAENKSFEIFKISQDGTRTTLLSTVNEPTDRRAPMGIAVDIDGNVYATVGNAIRKILPDGTVIVLAGSMNNDSGYSDGQGAEAQFNIPWGITVDASGMVYVADFLNNKIRKITPSGTVTTLAGSTYGSVDGSSIVAQFAGPIGLTVDSIGNIYVAESVKIRRITPDGTVTTVAGSTGGYNDGPTSEAQFRGPRSIAIDISGNMYITDHDNFVVRRISTDGMVATVAGSTFGSVDGSGASAKFCQTSGIAIDAGGVIYVTQRGGCGKIRKIVIN